MKQSLCVFGRLPALSLAELESLYGPAVQPCGAQAALLDLAVDKVNFARLGSSTRLCQVLTVLDTTDWHEVETHLLKTASNDLHTEVGSKLQLGLSTIGFKLSPAQLNATGLKLKKTIRNSGQSVRLTPNPELELSSAQVIHNHLTGPNGWELVLVRAENKTIIARTIAVQDIASYTLRDRGRPKRDARVGMLPPKLAQTIINLAVGQDGFYAPLGILDPFCGTGVILQEALLMGNDVYGTDIDPRMIDYSGENLEWLDERFELPEATMRIEQGDATNHQWDPKPEYIASETYLGRPFTALPSSEVLAQTAGEVNLILKKFLQNIGSQVSSGTRFCIAVPAWQIRPAEFKHLPLVDQLNDLGYNRVKFEHVRSDQLLYYREDQIVARELLVITRK